MLTKGLALGAAALLTATPIAAAERATQIVLVNGTGTGMQAMSVRRLKTETWQDLAPASGAEKHRVMRVEGEDCAFDIRATLGRDTVVWSGVNLCEVKTVILQRDASGGAWVDYD